MSIAEIVRKEQKVDRLLMAIRCAYDEACEKHPHFATNLNGGMTILTEEVGELAQAIGDYCVHGTEDEVDCIHIEALQVGAMIVRLLVEFDDLEAEL